jgi:uncharacterized protein (TIGR02145 family)
MNKTKINLILTALFATAMIVTSCGGNTNNKSSTDKQRVLKNEVSIGKQVWMSENLNVDKFRNGDSIPHAKTKEEWILAGEKKQPAWCYYENHKIQDNPKYGDKYGKLYNWYAVIDKRGLAPLGWHIPSDDEWTILTNQLGGKELARQKIKSNSGWENKNGSDSLGFCGLPGGCRKEDGTFSNLGQQGAWWSSSEDNPRGAGMFIYETGKPIFGIQAIPLSKLDFKVNGGAISVRCIKD